MIERRAFQNIETEQVILRDWQDSGGAPSPARNGFATGRVLSVAAGPSRCVDGARLARVRQAVGEFIQMPQPMPARAYRASAARLNDPPNEETPR
jgi:hypothetical protein